MFPAPSPNSQAILQSLQSGGATPSTIEFHRTALAAKKNGVNGPTSNPTSNPEQVPQQAIQQPIQVTAMDDKGNQAAAVDPFTHHEAADAANGLFMLAKGGQQMAQNPSHHLRSNGQADAARRASQNGATTNGDDMGGDMSDSQELSRSVARGRGKRNTSTRGANAANNRRKAEEFPAKGPNKKAKTSNRSASMEPSDPGDSSDEDQKGKQIDPKKMTDDEKRKNFLERNR